MPGNSLPEVRHRFSMVSVSRVMVQIDGFSEAPVSMRLRDPKRLSNLSDQRLWNRRTGDDGETQGRPVQRFLVIEARLRRRRRCP